MARDKELVLRRIVISRLDDESVAKEVKELIPHVEPQKVIDIAVEAQETMNRHYISLLMIREMARYSPHRAFVADALEKIIQSVDELTEFLKIYWTEDGKLKKSPLSTQVKKGLARVMRNLPATQIAEYNNDSEVDLHEALFLCHPKPENDEQQTLWDELIARTLVRRSHAR